MPNALVFAKLTFAFVNSTLPNCQNAHGLSWLFEPMIERTLEKGFDLIGYESSMKSKDEINFI